MENKKFPESQLPIRKTSELLPQVFQTDANKKFLASTLDPLVQPGVLQKTVGYVGRRYGKTFNGNDVYLDSDETLRSRYQLEPGVVIKQENVDTKFYDYLDFKNILRFFGNTEEDDNLVTNQEHYSWDPPISWDKFVNFREYYWVPEGPPPITITGQAQTVESTYRVKLGVTDSYILFPDGLTNNPTLTLYRGQKYRFIINAPGNGFTIRTSYDSGSLRYNPDLAYSKGSLVLFDEKLWRALNDIPQGDGSTIDENSQDWEYVEPVSVSASLDYNQGVTNNGIENGTLIFEIPFDAPDVLYYQSDTNPNRLGRFIIGNINSNTRLDVEKEILGKSQYTSSNGIELSNGMVIRFSGLTVPQIYDTDESWVVEGVGESITLVKFSDLIISSGLNLDVPEVLFDNAGFDTEPFDDAVFYAGKKDYIVINRGSRDSNPWSRYNRWFHRSVLEQAYKLSGSDFDSAEANRAKRPIIEFKENIKLFNHGDRAKLSVDFVDDFTTDVFSKIEGSKGYIVDGEELFQGARVLVIADTDNLANNRIYQVNFITHNNNRQINLVPASDSDSLLGECVLVKRGAINQRLMYHYDGTQWIKSQIKQSVNQPPRFEIFDEAGVSFSDTEKYPVSSFNGTEIVSYKVGTGIADTELGFSLSYLNIGNVGDIQYEFDWELDSFSYQINQITFEKHIRTGFYKNTLDDSYGNCWTVTDSTFVQPIIDSKVVDENTNTIDFNTVDWNKFDQETNAKLVIYLNGNRYDGSFIRTKSRFIFEDTLSIGDVITIKLFCDTLPDLGFYEIPIGLEENPLNDILENFTYGVAVDHIKSALEFNDDLIGQAVGVNNLRDISDYIQHSTKILKHAGIPALPISLLCDKQINLIKSIDYAKKKYTEFKSAFLDLSTRLVYNENVSELCDQILTELARTKTSEDSFADSDMAGTGAYKDISYQVEDVGITTFALSEKFDLVSDSRRAVYVYLNDNQLVANRDYEFDSTFGFLKILIELNDNDIVTIREYNSTASCFIPPTPTKLGLYKKYLPQKFLDDTYAEPKQVIQGHDGSINVAYNDFRDDLLLELEFRIYNNIKRQYNEQVFNIDNVLAGYYGVGEYSKDKVDVILNRQFLQWAADTNIDYVNNIYFDSENSFTYTYSNMTDRSQSTNLPGYWRGVYRWFYDTDRPHRCPWEMLGFSEQPDWWEDEYGPAPYTSGNLLLWEDLRDGIIRQGSRAGTYDRYKRSSLLEHIPVDADGNLLSPLTSNLAGNFSLINNQGDFKLGDCAPVEYAWKSSSEYPFAMMTVFSLLKPFEFISDNFTSSDTENNVLDQTINSKTKYFYTIKDIEIPVAGETFGSGLIKYVMDYLKSLNLSNTNLRNFLDGIDVKLSTRLSGFVDPENQKYVLDSKNPQSTSGSIFVPEENYDIIFNVSSPIISISYSGVIVEKTDRGFKIYGYDKLNPYFNYYKAIPSQTDSLINVGGVSESFIDWAEEKFYGNGIVIRYNNEFYRTLQSFTSGNTFTLDNLKKLPSLPVVQGVNALYRRNFDTLRVSNLIYGTVLSSVQEVVDFFLGYQKYLQSLGYVFDTYNTELGVANDFFTSAKEFMFWTRHNWQIGALISLSPLSTKIKLSNKIGVVDNLLDSFYGYSILKSDGTALDPAFIEVVRDFQEFTLSSVNTNEGIYFFSAHVVLKENVTIFDDRTVFNDVIYDKTTGYRQERIKSRGFRTTDWDGDYTSPGFIFDAVNIRIWEPYTDYKLGDIVSYKSFYYTSLISQAGTETFDNANWSKLDSVPSKKLVTNYDYRINQIEDYYDLDSEGLGNSQRDLARHLVGYQKRDYLSNLAEDETIQYKLYQGFIREKGTANSVRKIFDKTSGVDDDSIVLKEEWALLLSRYGGVDQKTEIEFNVTRDELKINPQPLIFTVSRSSGPVLDQFLRIPQADFTISKIPFTTDINPVRYFNDNNRSAGFVKLDQIEFTVSDINELLSLDINQVKENNHIWITFLSEMSWTVWRFNKSPILAINEVEKEGSRVIIGFGRPHSFSVGDVIGVKGIPNLTGFHQITEITQRGIVVETTSTQPVEFDGSTVNYIYEFTVAKYSEYQDLDLEKSAGLSAGSKLWIEQNKDQLWEVVEKNSVYSSKGLIDYGVANPRELGYRVLYSDALSQSIVSLPHSNQVLIYKESSESLSFYANINLPAYLENSMNFSLGKGMAISSDGRWLLIGAPNAGGIRSKFMGEYDPNGQYFAEEITRYANRLWTATDDMFGDGSTVDVYSDRWMPAEIIEASPIGRSTGYSNQGCVLIYEWSNQQWNYATTILSPSPDIDENFGHDISIGKTGRNYYVSVSAPGALENRGRVYLYKYENNSWKNLLDTRYSGIYKSATFYPAGSIVWYENKLYQAKIDVIGDGSTIGLTDVVSNEWVQIDPVSTESSLPKNIFLDDDGSTLASAMLTDNEIAELTKNGDQFGYSTAMNLDGSLLFVSSIYSDGQFFANYKGDWRSEAIYKEGDVVRNDGGYFKLIDPRSDVEDSSAAYTSQNEDPASDPWISVGDSTNTPTGKVFVYKRDAADRYQLVQTITAGNLADLNDTAEEFISSGDLFGYDLDIDYSGTTLIVSSPEADVNLISQGAVYVFENEDLSNTEFRLKQKLVSYESNVNLFFGSSIAITPSTEKIVVGARNAPFKIFARFDTELGTSFDDGTTIFSTNQGYPGQVYVYQKTDQVYLLAEKLQSDDLMTFESFGFSVDATASKVLVGSPYFQTQNEYTGNVRLFTSNPEITPWNIISIQSELVDVNLIDAIFVVDDTENQKLANLDVVDHFKNKIIGIAEQEINYKLMYDPAIYTVGNDSVVVDGSQNWKDKHVGEVWWDLRTVKWIEYEQGDTAYRSGNWNKLAYGATVDVYEWVESRYLPSEWNSLADTTEGLAENISGQTLYGDEIYSFKENYNILNGEIVEVVYYYWVKNKKTVPDIKFRRRSIFDVARLIETPQSGGIPLAAMIAANEMLLFNFDSLLKGNQSLVNVKYKQSLDYSTPIHREYQLLTEGQADSLPTRQIERKWIDSLIGFDEQGNVVPDPDLSIKQRYGISFRPRQSMFADRIKILKIVVDNINNILTQRPFADSLNLENLNSVDPLPSEELNEYDVAVDSFVDLSQIGTARVRQAQLLPNIVDGELESITILDTGFGYRNVPNIIIEGTGVGATAEITIDSQGRINSARVLTRGKKYTSAVIKIRQFSVLVINDQTANNFWSVYSWDQQRLNFYRSRSQGFNTTIYWDYADWWKSGYGISSRINIEITNYYLEPTLFDLVIGDLIKITEFGNGGWAVLERVQDGTGDIDGKYNLVGRQRGTIFLKDSLYNKKTTPLGFDNVGSFDTALYDLQPIQELRNIFKAVKEDIFIEDLSAEWNKLFFLSLRYILSEQQYVDWLFKTSFLGAVHNVGELQQKLSYKNDNLESYKLYLDEVKPYRTTIREFTSRYTSLDNNLSAVADFDLPPAYSEVDGTVLPINRYFDKTDQYPWKWWQENQGFGITEILVANKGSNYTNVPNVIIEGNGRGASAQAYISNGRVTKILVTSQGYGYTKTPTVTLVGGNGSSRDIATAVAILGDSLIRAFDIKLKFDRISKLPIYNNFSQTQTFVATGNTSIFNLNYASVIDKSKITVLKNSQIVLNNEYDISLFTVETDSYQILKGRLIFALPPAVGDIIEIVYEKNDELLDSVARIEKYYSPASGMKGNELNQLMTGIDFGGIQIQGTTFDITGGWDALPWFTEGWDSVESNSDFYVVADGSTNTITLPYVPAVGQLVTIYLKRNYISPYLGLSRDSTFQERIDNLQYNEIEQESRSIRIDDPYYDMYDGSTIMPNGRKTPPESAVMPTFVGDGLTSTIDFLDPIADVPYITTNAGDTLIFRLINSDGSLTIEDVNLVDTLVSGGSLSNVSGAYITANGTLAEEISIDGDKFISPDQVPSPEENIPGQVLDSLSVKVFNTTKTGAAPLQNKIYFGDDSSTTFEIDLEILELKSLIVYIDKIKKQHGIDYRVNFDNNTVIFDTAPSAGAVIEIISIGLGGIEILDYQEFVADGATSFFLTKARYDQTTNIFVTVDGAADDVGFVDSSEFTTEANLTLIQFGIPPAQGKHIKVVSLGVSNVDTDSTGLPVVSVNRQQFVFDGINRSFSLDGFVSLTRGSSKSSILVSVNNNFLVGVDTTYIIYNGTNNEIVIGIDPEEAIGNITSGNISVFINGVLQRFVIDYVFDGNQNLVIIPPANLTIGDEIKIEIDLRTEYTISSNDVLTISNGVVLALNDIIEVTWFGEYPTMDIISDEFSGGKVNYQLSRVPLGVTYIWVYVNGVRLTQDRDYEISLPRNVVYLNVDTVETDLIKIVNFGSSIHVPPVAYEIYKDMLNFNHFKRYSKNNQIRLARVLNYYDTEIEVTDGTLLYQPSATRNLAGIVEINNERIEYLHKNRNILSGLRRGSQGSAIAELHEIDSFVVDVGIEETVPYNEEQFKNDFVSDGSSLLIGSLEYVPAKSDGDFYRIVNAQGDYVSIPENYGRCDELEVFVAGRRLRKQSISIYNEALGSTSPESDDVLEAEFSVDGSSPHIRLTSAVPAGVRITVIKRIGRIWYERGASSASNGKTFLKNDTPYVRFINEKSSQLPE
jgi:hypothetical protein